MFSKLTDRHKLVWKEFVLEAFTNNGRRLKLRVGKWNNSVAENWEWMYHPTTNRLFNKKENRWEVYKCQEGRERRYQYQEFYYSGVRNYLPPECELATIFINVGKVYMTGKSEDIEGPQAIDVGESYRERSYTK